MRARQQKGSFPMSHPYYLPHSKLRKIWSPEDMQKLREDAAKFEALPAVPAPAVLTTDDEFDADMAYLRGMSGALFEFGTPAHITKLAEGARTSGLLQA
jgi:hypothetical protein